MSKTELRQQLKTCLLGIQQQQRQDKSQKACKHLFSMEQFRQAGTVMLYLSLPYEIDTSEAILNCWQSGKTVAVPKISWEQRHMIPVKINSLDTAFSTGQTGLRNPI